MGKSKRQSSYSRRGCTECKRAHLKCDEASPVCSRCRKYHKSCVYDMQFVLERYDNGKKSSQVIYNQLPKAFQPLKKSTVHPERKRRKLESPTLSSLNVMPNGTNFDISLNSLKLDDLVDILPNDANLLNMLASNDQKFLQFTQSYATMPTMHLFHIDWRNSSNLEYIHILQKYDPILNGSYEISDQCPVKLNDPPFLDLVWTLCRSSQFFYNFVSYPDEDFGKMMAIFQKLVKIQPIIQSIMIFNTSVFMVAFYQNTGHIKESQTWDRHIRIPTLKMILDDIKLGLASQCSFTKLVCMAFGVAIMFSVNSCDPNGAWRSNLRNGYKILVQASLLIDSIDTKNPVEKASLDLFYIVREWFFNVEFLAMVSSDNGGEITEKTPLDVMFCSCKNNPVVTLGNGINAIRGFSNRFTTFLLKLYDFIRMEKCNGVNLSGTNILQLIYPNSNSNAALQAKLFGIDLLWDLDSFEGSYKPLDIADLRMDITLKQSDIVYRMGIRFYVTFYLMGKRDPTQACSKLRSIIEGIFSIPYLDTCGVALHWIIYVCALASIIIKDDKLYGVFVEILRKIEAKGMYVCGKSIERLEYIKQKIEKKDYSHLASPHKDFIVF